MTTADEQQWPPSKSKSQSQWWRCNSACRTRTSCRTRAATSTSGTEPDCGCRVCPDPLTSNTAGYMQDRLQIGDGFDISLIPAPSQGAAFAPVIRPDSQPRSPQTDKMQKRARLDQTRPSGGLSEKGGVLAVSIVDPCAPPGMRPRAQCVQ